MDYTLIDGSVIVALAGLVVNAVRTEFKVSLMWKSHVKIMDDQSTFMTATLRRAAMEAVDKGIATKNSPLRFNDAAMSLLDPIKPELIDFWKHGGNKMKLNACAMALEKGFGNRLIDLACKPRHLHEKSCWLLAMAVASENPVIEIESDLA